ncbi:MAG: hypothetical protein EP338_06150 [Bacteroidetes bacterium]|nr:MAG: hypothetical protein EP338_06150 [Bacteroidota bacterium]
MTATKRSYLLSVLLLLSAFLFQALVYGQDEVDPSEIVEKKGRMWRLAKEAKRTGNAYLALRYYEEIYLKDSSNLKLIVEMAHLYRATHNYPKAEAFFEKITKSAKVEKYPEAYFYLGQAQKNNLKYSQAKENLLLFKKKKKYVKEEFAALRKLYKSELEGCDLAMMTRKQDSNSVVVRNLGEKVNHPHIDFSPIPIGENELIYGSHPEDKERIYKINDSLPYQGEKRSFMIARKTEDGWKSGGLLEGPFNDTMMDVANGCFSLDSTRFYFAKCTTNWQYKVVCTIYESVKEGGEWSEPVALPEVINMPDYTSSHPTVGRESKRNREVLYFVSDRPKSKGGTDIWFSEYDPRKKAFKKARNAGSKINTVGNEMTPFYDLPTKTMYFSTDGRANLGGLDVYYAIGETSKWQPAEHLNSDVNSSADDLDYTLRKSYRGGFFVSNRSGGQSLYHPTCCDDIYEFEFSKYIDVELLVQVTDQHKQILDKDVKVNLYVVDENSKLLVKTIANDLKIKQSELRPNQRYIIEAKKEGYFTNSIELSTEGIIENAQLEKTIELEQLPQEPIVIPNVKFEFDSPKLKPESKIALDTTILLLFSKQPHIKIEISAHTDNKGSDSYNLKLSQRRAESVVKYLNSKGVPMNQMIPKGYGETKPIAPNKNPDGSDNPAGRSLNRRVDFTILGEIDIELIELKDEEIKEIKRKKKDKEEEE